MWHSSIELLREYFAIEADQVILAQGEYIHS